MIKAPAQDLVAYRGDFWIEVRINDLREDRLVFRDLEGICDHAALRVTQPCRRLISLHHKHATFCSPWPDAFFFNARIEGEHSPQGLLVKRWKPNLQFVPEFVSVKPKHHSFGRLLSLIANSFAAGPKYAWRPAFLGYCPRQLSLSCASNQNKRVV